MLKAKLKRFVAAMLCFSIIAPIIPEFKLIEAKAVDGKYTSGGNSVLIETTDGWGNDPMYAAHRIAEIYNRVTANTGSYIDVLKLINDSMGSSDGEGTKRNTLTRKDNGEAVHITFDNDGPNEISMIPIRVTKGAFDIEKKLSIGAIDISGYAIADGKVQAVSVGLLIYGEKGEKNCVSAYYNVSDTNASVLYEEYAMKEAISYDSNNYILNGITVDHSTESAFTVWIDEDLYKTTYGEYGYEYMSIAGYNGAGGHVQDPLKELFKFNKDPQSNGQTLKYTITYLKSNLTQYEVEGITEDVDVVVNGQAVIGGTNVDVISISNGKAQPNNIDPSAWRAFASESIAEAQNQLNDGEDISSYINHKFYSNDFICQFINEAVKQSSSWKLDFNGEELMTDTLDIYDPFHMIETYMFWSVKYCHEKDQDKWRDSITFSNASNPAEVQPVSVSDLSGMFDTLTGYQKAALAKTYTRLMQGAKVASGKQFFDFMYIKDEKSGIGSFEYGDNDSVSMAPDIDEEQLKHDVKNFENSTYVPSTTPIDIARYADLLARYSYITSSKYRADISEEDTDVYSAYLESMGNDMWNISNGVIGQEDRELSADMIQIPQDVRYLENSYGMLIEDSINTAYGSEDYAFDRMQMILYGVSYAFLITARSEFAEESKYSPADLRLWINGKGTSEMADTYSKYFEWLYASEGLTAYESGTLLEKTDFPADGNVSVWMFQAVIALHDLCEHFGIDPATWNKDIYEYYMIYEDNPKLMEALRKNPVFMGLGYTGDNTADNPLGRLFSIQDRKMSDNWIRGFALSSSYTPMVTNLYDASTYDSVEDGTWLTDYFYRYGFHRKALYISTDPNIVVNSKVGRTSSNGRKVCTLSDLLNYDRDIELYIDTGFYNADDIEEGLGRVDYATIRAMVEEQALQSTKGSEAAKEQLESESKAADDILKGAVYNRNYIDETLNLDTASLLKDDGVTTYSTDVAQRVTKFGETADLSTSLYDAYVLSSESIIGDGGVFDMYQYSALLGYGVVSAIYRDTNMFNTIMASTTSDTTVFRSSKNIIMCDDSTYKDWLSYFNYLMLGNLEKQMNVNVDSLLDLNAPVFIDLFGNIVTESGYVIIPAAANPTLCGLNWNPYCVGFASYLNNNNEVIKTTDCTPQFLTWITGTEYTTVGAASINGDTVVDLKGEVDGVNLDSYRGTGGWFIVDTHGRVILKNVELTSNGLTSIVSWSTLNAHSDVNLRIFNSDAYYSKGMKMYGSKMIMLTTEVLRGAPIETIDYEKEGLTNVAKGEAGIVIAYALDKIFEAISSRGGDYVNSMLTMPNLALQPYLKYIIYFGIKICVLAMVLLLMINLFKSGIQGRLGFKYAFSFVFTTVIVASAVYILPSSIKWSYDNANARLLSTEACDIVLYDAMRNSEGQQIGITNVEKIDECTELYMEVGKVHVNWQNVLTKGLLTNEYTSFQDIFDDAMKEDPMANQWGVINKGSSLYMSTRDIYDSTRIVYNAQTNTLTNKIYTTGNIQKSTLIQDTLDAAGNTINGVNEESAIYAERDTGAAVYSFVSPYYTFLDMIIADINDYNQSHDIKSYNFSADKYGGVITYDVASPYLLSDEFLYDGYDILGLYQIMRTQQQKPSNVYIFSSEDIARMSMSEWYDLDLTEEQKIEKIEQVYDYARAFVSDHRTVLKHIPDGMFVKSLAFACAVKYNQVFRAPHADSVKMLQVDNRDIMRFMLGDFYTVYSNYPYSFGRFVYKSAGTAGVLLSLILSVIILVSNVIKPVLIAIMFVLIIINICFRELLLNKPNWGVEGYFIGCGLFIVTNLVYALLLKLTMMLANTGYPVVLAIIVAIVVQLAYMAALCALIYMIGSNWKDLGFGKMRNMMMQIGGFIGRGRYGFGYGGYGRGYGGYGSAYGGYGGYGNYGGYGGYGGRGFNRGRRGFGRHQISAYGDYDAPAVDIELSRREERRRNRLNEMRTVDDMYARDEERYDNAFRRRGRR